MNAALLVVGGVLTAQALLYVFGDVKRGWKLGPRLESYNRSEDAWRAGLRRLAPLQVLAGLVLVAVGATSSPDDDAPGVVGSIVLIGLGTYLGHRAAAQTTPAD